MQLKQTNTLRSVFEQGYAETRHFGAQGLTLDYLFLAILKQEGGHASYLLRKLLKEWEIYQIKIRIENDLKRAQADAVSMNPVLLPSVKESEGSILIRLAEETDDPRHNLLNTAHLLMAIVKDRSSICGQVLAMYNVNSETLSEFVRELPPNEDYYEDMKILDEMSADREAEHYFTQFKPRPQAETESEPAMPVRKERKSPSSDPLIRFGVDLTLAAREGRLDPVIGRDEEIERLVQILGRRKKNNPVLIGEPGVGKSAIVEGLALRIVDNDVPVALRDKRVFALDVASLVAGTKYRGEFEERINTLLGELRKTNNVILFIDEIHTIVGAGSTQGSLDTANILKRVAVHRSDDAARIPGEYRNRRSARTPFPEDYGRAAVARTDARCAAQYQTPVRGASRGALYRCGADRLRRVDATLCGRPFLPRQGYRRDGRGREPRACEEDR